VVTDLIAGQITFLMDSIVSAQTHIKDGRVRALAVTGAQRSGSLPDVPTFTELGVPGLAFSNWFGFFAPAGTPARGGQRGHRAAGAHDDEPLFDVDPGGAGARAGGPADRDTEARATDLDLGVRRAHEEAVPRGELRHVRVERAPREAERLGAPGLGDLDRARLVEIELGAAREREVHAAVDRRLDARAHRERDVSRAVHPGAVREADRRARAVPVIVITPGPVEGGWVKELYAAGVSSVVIRPPSFDGLVDLMSLLGRYWLQLVTLSA